VVKDSRRQEMFGLKITKIIAKKSKQKEERVYGYTSRDIAIADQPRLERYLKVNRNRLGSFFGNLDGSTVLDDSEVDEVAPLTDKVIDTPAKQMSLKPKISTSKSFAEIQIKLSGNAAKQT